MQILTIHFSNLHLSDTALVGGKNSSLGEMYTTLRSKGIKVPEGFATTAEAFWYFLDSNNLRKPLQELLINLDRTGFSNLRQIGEQARKLILEAYMPGELSIAIIDGYKQLCGENEIEVAVRSSATAEDLPQASFAGQHESYSNIWTQRLQLPLTG